MHAHAAPQNSTGQLPSSAPARPAARSRTHYSSASSSPQADAEEGAFNRGYNGQFGGLFLIALAVLAFVALRGA